MSSTSSFVQECEDMVNEAVDKLEKDSEWIKRYQMYAKEIIQNIDKIKERKARFNQWAPLYLYMPVGLAKKSMNFSLRYLGQDIAKLTVGIKVTISTQNFNDKNLRDFNCDIKLDKELWNSKKSAEFRKHFSDNPARKVTSGKKNDEHMIESMLLTEFSKTTGREKALCKIQPVKIAGVARFQMPTPFSASGKSIKYSLKGGGIDILARIGKGRGTKLCVMEIKTKEDRNAIKQGLAYATFILKLLRTKETQSWWNIFGFNRSIPKKLVILVVAVLPKSTDSSKYTSGEIKLGEDSLMFKYLYYDKCDNQIIIHDPFPC